MTLYGRPVHVWLVVFFMCTATVLETAATCGSVDRTNVKSLSLRPVSVMARLRGGGRHGLGLGEFGEVEAGKTAQRLRDYNLAPT